MARVLRVIGLLVALVLILVAGFWFWASSGTLPESEMLQTKTYEGKPATAADTLSVMTYNIGYLSGMTNNEPVPSDPALYAANLEKAIDLIRGADPDIIGFQEIDFGAERSIGVQQLDTLAQRLSYPAGAQAVNWDVRYLPFPYGAPSVHYGQTLSGQAILSRFPIADHRRHVLAETSRPYLSRVFYLDRLAQVADLVIGQDTLSVVNVHLEAFEKPVRLTQADEVRDLLAELVATDRPVLLIGDFNAMPDATDDATLDRVRQDLPFELAVPSSSDADALATYPGDAPTRLIDHIFYMPTFMRALSTDISCGANPDPPSDHCAVTTKFVMASDSTETPE